MAFLGVFGCYCDYKFKAGKKSFTTEISAKLMLGRKSTLLPSITYPAFLFPCDSRPVLYYHKFYSLTQNSHFTFGGVIETTESDSITFHSLNIFGL